jgi:hypothetical protein
MSHIRAVPFAFFFALFVSGFSIQRDARAQQMFAMGRSGNTSTLLSVTAGPFSVTSIGSSTLGHFAGLDFQPGTNTLFAASGSSGPNSASLFTVDPNTGSATLIGAIGVTGDGVVDLAIDNAGTIFGSDFESLYSIDPNSGVGTAIGPILDGIEGLAVDPTTDILYGLVWDTGELFSVDKQTSATTLVTVFGAPPVDNGQWNGFGIDGSGNFFGTVGSGNGHIFSLNPSNSSMALLGDAFDGSVSDIAFQREVVPEPASIVLLSQIGLCLVGFGLYRARRKK